MKQRSLWPKEHGAYAQLALPTLAALAMGGVTAASLAWAVGVWALFLAHEPLLVMLGHRGPRARREDGARARRALGLGLAVGALAGAAALAGFSFEARAAVALAVALALPVALLAWRRQEKTTLGESLAAVALVGAAGPVVVTSGVGTATRVAFGVAWIVTFLVGTWAVRGVIASGKKDGARGLLWAAAGLGLAATLGGVAWVALAQGDPWLAFSPAPTILMAWIMAARPPSARHLKALGVGLVATGTLTAVALLLGAS